MNRRIRRVFPALMLLAGLAALTTGSVAAQQHIEELPTGQIALIPDDRPATWAMSGYELLHLHCTVDGCTPIMRILQLDARLVEIMWRKEDRSLEWDGRVLAIGPNVVVHMIDSRGSHYDNNELWSVRHCYYLLIKVRPKDAQAEHTSVETLARKWAQSAQRGISNVFPIPAVFGG